MIKKKRRPTQEVNSSSMADLSWSILFFILFAADFALKEMAVTGEMVTDVIEEVQEGGLDGNNKSEWIIEIVEDGNGGAIYYLLEGERMPEDEIKARVMEAVPSISKIGIFGSKEVPHGKVIDFFSYCSRINIPAYEGVINDN